MTHVLHIFRKDVRRLRWALIVWIAAVVLGLVLKTVGAELSYGAIGPQIAVMNASDLLVFIEILLLAVIVSGLVHDEPLVGADAFWLTRPIGGRTLLAAKLLFAVLLLVVLPATGESIVMTAVSADPQVALRAATEYAFNQLLVVAVLMALATVTPSLMRFLMTLIGCVVAVAIALTVLVGLLLAFSNVDGGGVMESIMPDPTSGVIATLLVACAALLAVAYQYRQRRTGRAVAIGVIGVIVAVVVADQWPWHFARPAEPDPGAWAQDAGRTAAVLEQDAAPRTQDDRGMNRGVARKFVAAPIRLEGTPPEYSADRIATRTRVEFPDGTAFESAQAADIPIDGAVATHSGRTERLQAALGSPRLLTMNRRFNTWPIVLKVSDEAYKRYGGVPGRLTTQVYFFMFRSKLVGALPLAERASLRDGPRMKVLRVLRRSEGCTLLVRQIRTGSLWKPSVPTQYDFVLRNAGRGEAVLAGVQPLTSPAPRIASAFIPGGLHVNGSAGGDSTFVDMVMEFPSREYDVAVPALDSAWLDGADLAVIETAYAGRVSRTLTVDGFKMR